jgi:hypothetical protein
MTKSIVLSQESWTKIYNHIAQTHPPSVLLIRNKMQKVLGFTNRLHEQWVDQEVDFRDVRYSTKYCVQTVHLDFYNEPKRTMFLLKYSEYLDNSGNTNS